MKISILGIGSIGTLFAALLSRTEHEIHLHGRGEHLAMIATNGITVIGEESFSIESQRFDITFEEAGIPSNFNADSDVVIITGKARSLASLGQLAAKIIKPDGIGPAGDGPSKIDLLCLVGKPTSFFWQVVAEVPLTNHAGGISFLLGMDGRVSLPSSISGRSHCPTIPRLSRLRQLYRPVNNP